MPDVNASFSLSFVAPADFLAPPADGAFDGMANLAAMAMSADVALVELVDGWGIWNAREDRAGLGTSIAVRGDAIQPLSSAAALHQLADPVFAKENDYAFYACVPLRADRITLGRLVVVSRSPRDPSAEEVALLRALAGVIVETFELRVRACQQLRRASGARTRTK